MNEIILLNVIVFQRLYRLYTLCWCFLFSPSFLPSFFSKRSHSCGFRVIMFTCLIVHYLLITCKSLKFFVLLLTCFINFTCAKSTLFAHNQRIRLMAFSVCWTTAGSCIFLFILLVNKGWALSSLSIVICGTFPILSVPQLFMYISHVT